MDELILTRADIENDIAGYELRLQTARDRLRSLPVSAKTHKKVKQLKRERRALQAEIDHVKRLIGYAEAALLEC